MLAVPFRGLESQTEYKGNRAERSSFSVSSLWMRCDRLPQINPLRFLGFCQIFCAARKVNKTPEMQRVSPREYFFSSVSLCGRSTQDPKAPGQRGKAGNTNLFLINHSCLPCTTPAQSIRILALHRLHRLHISESLCPGLLPSLPLQAPPGPEAALCFTQFPRL